MHHDEEPHHFAASWRRNDEIYDYTEARWGQDQAEGYTFGIRQAL